MKTYKDATELEAEIRTHRGPDDAVDLCPGALYWPQHDKIALLGGIYVPIPEPNSVTVRDGLGNLVAKFPADQGVEAPERAFQVKP